MIDLWFFFPSLDGLNLDKLKLKLKLKYKKKVLLHYSKRTEQRLRTYVIIRNESIEASR